MRNVYTFKWFLLQMILLTIFLGSIVTAHRTRTIVKHTEADENELNGHWVQKTLWKARWVKYWRPKYIYVPVWKKVWSPIVQNEWMPLPKPVPEPEGSWKRNDNNLDDKVLVKQIIE